MLHIIALADSVLGSAPTSAVQANVDANHAGAVWALTMSRMQAIWLRRVYEAALPRQARSGRALHCRAVALHDGRERPPGTKTSTSAQVQQSDDHPYNVHNGNTVEVSLYIQEDACGHRVHEAYTNPYAPSRAMLKQDLPCLDAPAARTMRSISLHLYCAFAPAPAASLVLTPKRLAANLSLLNLPCHTKVARSTETRFSWCKRILAPCSALTALCVMALAVALTVGYAQITRTSLLAS